MLSPYKIMWDQRSSLEFNVLTDIAFDSDNGTVETHLGREAVISETYNGALRRAHNYKWNDSLTFQLTIIKNDYSDFSSEENRKILKWLTSRHNAGFIDIYKKEDLDKPEEIAFSVLGNFINVSSYKLGNGRIAGYVADWESLTPYAMSKLHTVSKPISDPMDNKIVIDIDTDEPSQPVFPRITIKEKGSIVNIPEGTIYNIYSDMVPNTVYFNGINYYWKSDLPALCTGATEPDYDWEVVTVDTAYTSTDIIESNKIYYYSVDRKYRWIDPYTFKESETDPKLITTSVRFVNRHTDLSGNVNKLNEVVAKNNTLTEEIVLDGANKIVSSNSVRRIFGEDFNWQWLELYDGHNEITIEGNCEVELEYRTVIKCGEH